tara:strand:+ start:794 stop:919 length:126 start_codon:yes stop_codon:yes gene_type:complete
MVELFKEIAINGFWLCGALLAWTLVCILTISAIRTIKELMR